jgi:hypothetical protein
MQAIVWLRTAEAQEALPRRTKTLATQTGHPFAIIRSFQ